MSNTWIMHVNTLVLVCSVCAGQRQSVQNRLYTESEPSTDVQLGLSGRVNPGARQDSSRALARLFLAHKPAAAFQPPASRLDLPVWKRRIGVGRHMGRATMMDEQESHQPLTKTMGAAAAMASAMFLPLCAFAEDAVPDNYWIATAKQLGLYAGQQLINVGAPATAAIIVIFYFFRTLRKGRRVVPDTELPPALASALGFGKEPKEFLEIERLNDKLQSFDYSLTKAMISKESALRANRKLSLQQRIGSELASFDLSADTVKKLEEAEKKYRKREERLDKALEKKLRELRAMPFQEAAKKSKEASKADAAKSEDSQEKEEEEFDMEEDEEEEKKGFKMPKMPSMGEEKDGAMRSLQSSIDSLQRRKRDSEMFFLSSISKSLSPEQASAFAAAIKPSQPLTSSEPGAGALDAIAALEHVASMARAQPKHVWVLKFFGDVTASQVSSLRQEVTAVLRAANVSRGDEVLIVLNTGGGTVTGYGLAGAQLTRIKKAGLKLTVAVEQVAASGGYLMACVADEIFAAPFAVIGSIGVITEIPNVYERLKKEGIEFSTVTAGKYKRTLTPFKKVDDLDKKKTKEDIESVFGIFKDFVDTNRPQVDIEKVATGETWLGPDALKMKLVDGLVTVDELLSKHVDSGAEVLGVKYKMKQSPLAALSGAGGQLGLGSTLGGTLASSLTWQELALALVARMMAPKSGAIDESLVRSAMSGVAPEFSNDASEASATESFERRYMLKSPSGKAEPMYYWNGEEDDGDSWSF
mmetsp:Transcript_142085/g.250550  ORF Transcript_142085/g.250550 Transcript_142085/m.250550 type:complete len:756 (-) Transcript_142085:184-2451(-)